MNEYLCAWEIDIAADSPEEAAQLAESLMTGRQASAWTITDKNGVQFSVTVKEAH